MLDLTAKRYGQRPSSIIGIHDPYVAYCFDSALAYRMTLSENPAPSDNTPTRQGRPRPRGRRDMRITNGMLTGGFSGVIGEIYD